MLGLSPKTPRHFDFGGGCTRARRSCRSSLLDALETRRRFERLSNERDDSIKLNLFVLLSKNSFFSSKTYCDFSSDILLDDVLEDRDRLILGEFSSHTEIKTIQFSDYIKTVLVK